MKKILVPLFSLAALAAVQTATAATGEELMNSKGCMACHQLEVKIVGPAYKEVAAKRSAEEDGRAVVVESILKGSSGVYGPIPMPPNAVNQEEAEILADWILSL